MRVTSRATAAVAIVVAMAAAYETAWAQGKGKPPQEPTIYPVTIEFDNDFEHHTGNRAGRGVWLTSMVM